jgi:hypothetical protein
LLSSLAVCGSQSIVHKACELDHVGGTFSQSIKPTPFLCLVLKLLQVCGGLWVAVMFQSFCTTHSVQLIRLFRLPPHTPLVSLIMNFGASATIFTDTKVWFRTISASRDLCQCGYHCRNHISHSHLPASPSHDDAAQSSRCAPLTPSSPQREVLK